MKYDVRSRSHRYNEDYFQHTRFYVFNYTSKFHSVVTITRRMSCTSGQHLCSLQLATIHEMRKSIMHFIMFSSRWYRLVWQTSTTLQPTLMESKYIYLLVVIHTVNHLCFTLSNTDEQNAFYIPYSQVN